MKVALIADSDTQGGAEEYLYHLYRKLKTTYNIEVDLFGFLPGWSTEIGRNFFISKGKKLSASRGIIAQTLASLHYASRINQVVDLSKYDIVHIQFMKEKLFLPQKFFRSGKVVWTEHGPLPTNLPSLAYPILRWRARRSKVVAVSLSVQESLYEKKIQSTVIRNPFPEVKISNHFAYSLTGENPIIAFAGRIHSAKRIYLLQGVAERNPHWEFIIAGTGPEYESLRNQQTENFHVIGHILDVSNLLVSANVLVITSGREAREGFPLVALEARVLGTHVAIAEDCHAALEALEIGAELFSPTIESLEIILKQILSKDRKKFLPPNDIANRSTDLWAHAHYQLFNSIKC